LQRDPANVELVISWAGALERAGIELVKSRDFPKAIARLREAVGACAQAPTPEPSTRQLETMARLRYNLASALWSSGDRDGGLEENGRIAELVLPFARQRPTDAGLRAVVLHTLRTRIDYANALDKPDIAAAARALAAQVPRAQGAK